MGEGEPAGAGSKSACGLPREEDVSLMLQFDVASLRRACCSLVMRVPEQLQSEATCAYDDASEFQADGSIILRVKDVSLGENCANYTDADA